MEKTERVEFNIGDNKVIVELKFKLDNERLYIKDEMEGWVRINSSAMIARDLMTVKDPSVLVK